ncbi:MAG: ECF-type riboflavin transporter substrate-binding protein [Treponema sp.]|jgi:energy-coupling factor transport system substrate-specific component|nr:ECF-type riboflavin transporter substrate-binding protein [Treponema sp.]
MERKLFTAKTAAAICVGAALMFALNRFAAIHAGVVNIDIQFGIAILAAFAAVFGPVAGIFIGLIGHFLVDLTAGWGIWWSWIISSAIFGFTIGACWKMYLSEEGRFGVKQAVMFNIVQIASNVLVWVFIARTLDMLIYNEPFGKVSLQGFTAAGINSAVVLALGTLLIAVYYKIRTKSDKAK